MGLLRIIIYKRTCRFYLSLTDIGLDLELKKKNQKKTIGYMLN